MQPGIASVSDDNVRDGATAGAEAAAMMIAAHAAPHVHCGAKRRWKSFPSMVAANSPLKHAASAVPFDGVCRDSAYSWSVEFQQRGLPHLHLRNVVNWHIHVHSVCSVSVPRWPTSLRMGSSRICWHCNERVCGVAKHTCYVCK
jgi:hypothetical protein